MTTVTSADGTAIAFERLGAGTPLILAAGAFNDRSHDGAARRRARRAVPRAQRRPPRPRRERRHEVELEVQTHTTCGRNPVALKLAAERVFRVRGGAIAVDYGDPVEVEIGTSTVVIFTADPRVGGTAARELRMRGSQSDTLAGGQREVRGEQATKPIRNREAPVARRT